MDTTTIETTKDVVTDALSTELENTTDHTVAKTLTIAVATMATLTAGYYAFGKAKAFTIRKLAERAEKTPLVVVEGEILDPAPTEKETVKV